MYERLPSPSTARGWPVIRRNLSAAAHIHPVTNTTDVWICRGRSGQGVKIDFEHKDVVKWIYRFE